MFQHKFHELTNMHANNQLKTIEIKRLLVAYVNENTKLDYVVCIFYINKCIKGLNSTRVSLTQT